MKKFFGPQYGPRIIAPGRWSWAQGPAPGPCRDDPASGNRVGARDARIAPGL